MARFNLADRVKDYFAKRTPGTPQRRQAMTPVMQKARPVIQAAKQTLPTLASKFGSLVRDQGFTGPFERINPYTEYIRNLTATTLQPAFGGTADVITAGARQTQPLTPIQRVKEFGRGIYGVGKVAAVATPLFQGMNLLASSPLPIAKTDLLRRVPAGVLRGMSQEKGLAPNVPPRDVKLSAFGQDIKFDPAMVVGEMAGFVAHPVNKALFGATNQTQFFRLEGKIQNFLANNLTRGAIEDVAMSIKDMPTETANEAIKFLATQAVFGAIAETGTRGAGEVMGSLYKGLRGLLDGSDQKLFDTTTKKVTNYYDVRGDVGRWIKQSADWYNKPIKVRDMWGNVTEVPRGKAGFAGFGVEEPKVTKGSIGGVGEELAKKRLELDQVVKQRNSLVSKGKSGGVSTGRVVANEQDFIELDNQATFLTGEIEKLKMQTPAYKKRMADLEAKVAKPPVTKGSLYDIGKPVRVFRGTTSKEIGTIPREGLSTSIEKNVANRYAQARGPEGFVDELFIDPRAKIIKGSDIPNEVRGLGEGSDFMGKAAIWARKQGYDVIDATGKGTAFAEQEMRILNPKVLKSSVAQLPISDVAEKGKVVFEPSLLSKKVAEPGTAINFSNKYAAQVRYKGLAVDEQLFNTKEQAQKFLDDYKFKGIDPSVQPDWNAWGTKWNIAPPDPKLSKPTAQLPKGDMKVGLEDLMSRPLKQPKTIKRMTKTPIQGIKVGDIVSHVEDPNYKVKVTKLFNNGGAEFEAVDTGVHSAYRGANISETGKTFEQQFTKFTAQLPKGDIIRGAERPGAKVTPVEAPRGTISKLEREIDHLIGYEPQGLHWKQEGTFRNTFINEIRAVAPPKVMKKVEKLQNALEEIRYEKTLKEPVSFEAEPKRMKAFNRKAKKLKLAIDDLKLEEDFFKTYKDEYGRTIGVGAEPGGELSKKTQRKVLLDKEAQVKADFDQWQRSYRQQTKTRTPAGMAQDIGRTIRKATKSVLSDVEKLKDISNFAEGARDVYRNFKAVYGKNIGEAKRLVLDPFDKSKGDMIRMWEEWLPRLDKNVVDLGIKRKSPQSRLVQLYGEKKISLNDLKKQAPKDWEKIVRADNWFRKAYDQLLDEVNAVRRRIYPNDPTKIIKKRQDYYRHFREMAEMLGGLRNLFETPAHIPSTLAGVSAYTKPRSKWLSFAQERLTDQTEFDAVGGFLDYLKAASYAKHIDPHIAKFRGLSDELAGLTEKGAHTGKLNNFIEFLNDFSDDLAGKTNPFDRAFQKWIPGGRKSFRFITWLNSRVKANVILGNLSASLAQLGNVPQGVASAGRYSARGFGKTLASIFTDNKAIKQSDFIKERYASSMFDKYRTGMMKNPKRLAIWITQVLDEVGAKFMWNAHYEKGLAESIPNPIKYADDMTRNLTAGRGIGEVPLIQKSKVFQIVAPFQVEVGNFWWVMKDMVDERQFGKLATLFLASYIYNRGVEKIRGNPVVLDPIQAMIDVLNEEDQTPLKAGGRIVGEVLSNIPLGQTAAAMYPEYGFKVGEKQYPTRKQFFGSEDPTRFGSGLLLAKGLQDPLYKILPGFGGQQLKRTIQGGQAVQRGYSQSKTGRVRYPIKQDPLTKIRGATLGEYSLPEAREYFERETTPLGTKQTERFKELGVPYYEKVMAKREQERAKKRELEGKEEKKRWWKGWFDKPKEAGAAEESVKQALPSSTEDLKTLYKNSLSVMEGYRAKKTKIQYGQYEAELDRDEALVDLEEKYKFAKEMNNRIEKERPEQVFELQIDTYKSGGGQNVESRSKWAADQIKGLEGEKRQEMINRLWDTKVLTGTASGTGAYIKEKYGIDVGKYTGTQKGKGTKAKVKKAKALIKASYKKISPGKVSTAKTSFKKPAAITELKKARIVKPEVGRVQYSL